MTFIGWIIIGVVAGWLAEKIMKRDHGLFTNLVVGVVGAFIGGLIMNFFGFDGNSWIFSLITAVLGAVILLWVLGLVKNREK